LFFHCDKKQAFYLSSAFFNQINTLIFFGFTLNESVYMNRNPELLLTARVKDWDDGASFGAAL
jgi:hypothetical protein